MANNLQDLWGGAKSDYTINGPLAGVLAGQASEMQRSQMQDQTLQEAIASRQKQAEYDRYNQMTPGMIQEQNGKAGFEGARGTLAQAGLAGNLKAQERQQKIDKFYDAFTDVAPYYSDDSNLSFDNFQQYLDPETAAIVGPQVKNYAKIHNLPEQAAFKTMFKSLSDQRDNSNPAYRQAVATGMIREQGNLDQERIKQQGAQDLARLNNAAGRYAFHGAPPKEAIDKFNSLPIGTQYSMIKAGLESGIDPVTKTPLTPESKAFWLGRLSSAGTVINSKVPIAKPGTIDVGTEAGIATNPDARVPLVPGNSQSSSKAKVYDKAKKMWVEQ